MTHDALSRACRNVGGQTALASLIGVKQQHVWAWLHTTSKGPAPEYVLKIEEAALVSRQDLRPDLYPAGSGGVSAVTFCTDDGVWIARDPGTNTVASGATLPEAVAELRRLLSARQAA